jgi:hypothetical protein
MSLRDVLRHGRFRQSDPHLDKSSGQAPGVACYARLARDLSRIDFVRIAKTLRGP